MVSLFLVLQDGYRANIEIYQKRLRNLLVLTFAGRGVVTFLLLENVKESETLFRSIISIFHLNNMTFLSTAFILHRGRVLLRLDTDVVQCKTVSYTSPQFLSQYEVHVQASINYYDSGPNSTFVHDAAVTWTEKINIANFTVCALKAGRNDRVTPDGGRTFVDYIAYQGSPSGAVAGEEVINNWWDGTTCKMVSLPQVRHSHFSDVIFS